MRTSIRFARQRGCRLAAAATLSFAMMIMLFGFASISSAAASTSHSWTCKPAVEVYCFDPEGLANWQQGKIKLLKGYKAALCIGVKKGEWEGGICSGGFREAGEEAYYWPFGTAYASHDPLHGWGYQYNEQGHAEEIWLWFYEP